MAESLAPITPTAPTAPLTWIPISCPTCGGLLAQQHGDHFVIHHQGRKAVVRAVDLIVCGRVYGKHDVCPGRWRPAAEAADAR